MSNQEFLKMIPGAILGAAAVYGLIFLILSIPEILR